MDKHENMGVDKEEVKQGGERAAKVLKLFKETGMEDRMKGLSEQGFKTDVKAVVIEAGQTLDRLKREFGNVTKPGAEISDEERSRKYKELAEYKELVEALKETPASEDETFDQFQDRMKKMAA